MLGFLQRHQLNIMLIFIGACLITSVYVLMSRTARRYRKELMFFMQIAALLLLSSDRFAYIYRGDVSTLGYVMVRICNFMVFFMTLVLQYIFTLYLNDLFTHEGGLDGEPGRLKLTKGLILAGILLLVISQYTGFYYTLRKLEIWQPTIMNAGTGKGIPKGFTGR